MAPGPKKKISKVKIYETTEGDHRISPDGKELYIGGHKFVRTVLPSVATRHVESENFASDLDALDAQIVKETDETK